MRKIMYGIIGIAIGFIYYTFSSISIPSLEKVNSNPSDFHLTQNDYDKSLNDISGGSITTIFEGGSYRLSDSQYENYKEIGLAKYGKPNPMFHYIPAITLLEDDVDSDNKENMSMQKNKIINGIETTTSENQVVKKANEYLTLSTFSKEDLIKQLLSEGFTKDESTYAVNTLNVNWNEQASRKAKEYLNSSSFSKDDLNKQLLSEGFTKEEAEYGVNSVYENKGGKLKENNEVKIEDLLKQSNLTGYNLKTNIYEEIDVSLQLQHFMNNGTLPVDKEHFNISSKFGGREDPFNKKDAVHTGLDIASKNIEGERVYSSIFGYVSSVKRDSNGYGNHIIIDHGDYTTVYAHLKTIKVNEGDLVNKGDTIGTVGSTGRSTGPHLHFEIRINDIAVDPSLFILGLEMNE